jgi:hypothetical protein
METDKAIKERNQRSRIYLIVIACLIFAFVYFIFFSVSYDVSTINGYLTKQSRVNFIYSKFFKEYIDLIERRAIIKPYVRQVESTTGDIESVVSNHIPPTVLFSFLTRRDTLGIHGHLADEYLSLGTAKYQDITNRMSYLGEVIKRVDRGEDFNGFIDPEIGSLDSLYEKIVMPANHLTLAQSNNSFMMYLVFGVFVLLFGVFMSLYRGEMKEIAKLESLKFAFLRVRIAGNNYKEPGFKSEVREALTKTAFEFEKPQAGSIFQRKGKIESPLPGHPTSDLVTLILNKVLENMGALDIKIKEKQDGKDKNGSQS